MQQVPTSHTIPGHLKSNFHFEPSFGPYLDYLRNKMLKADDIRVKFYRHIISKFEKFPALTQPFAHDYLDEQHNELIQLLRMSLLPLASSTSDHPMALGFMQPQKLFYYTDSFRAILLADKDKFAEKEDEHNQLKYFIRLVLEKFYAVPCGENEPFIRQVINEQNHTIHHYYLHVDTHFVAVHVNDELPAYDPRWYEALYLKDAEFEQAIEAFPALAFRLTGFIKITVSDVSRQIAQDHLKNVVLNMFSVSLEKTLQDIESGIGELLNDSRIKIGITPFFTVNNKVVYDDAFITKSILVASQQKCPENRISISHIFDVFRANPQPFIIAVVDDKVLAENPFVADLALKGLKSYVAYPISDRNTMLGVFELASAAEGALNKNTYEYLQSVFPFIAEVISFMLQSFTRRIERLVKENFTSLQPAVEWKFSEVAWQYLQRDPHEENVSTIGNVIFEDVYPLYGAVDIRNSSIERNLAAQQDSIAQLQQAMSMLQQISRHLALPLTDGVEYKCSTYLQEIQHSWTAESEMKVADFFEWELKPFFKYLAGRHSEFSESIHAYFNRTSRTDGDFHLRKRNYESSVQAINKLVLCFFEKEIEKLLHLYPFYFEKYRTDGVEYNMYIGQSIIPEQAFDFIFVKNLRLWQITSMVQVAKLNEALLPTLALPLQTTQLILVHHHTIDISFRKDERRFDVEGSYNIRYEILKKRIDKVRIKDTMERLTQPGTIAIVYSNPDDVHEYQQHIEFLKAKGTLQQNVEMLDLEELQGVSGLKAIRVHVVF